MTSVAVKLGIPIPAMSSALAFYDGYSSEVLPANLIQAQRDYFGAHTYELLTMEGNWVSIYTVFFFVYLLGSQTNFHSRYTPTGLAKEAV